MKREVTGSQLATSSAVGCSSFVTLWMLYVLFSLLFSCSTIVEENYGISHDIEFVCPPESTPVLLGAIISALIGFIVVPIVVWLWNARPVIFSMILAQGTAFYLSLLAPALVLISSFASGFLAAIMFLIKKFYKEKLPQWIEEALDRAVPFFLALVVLSLLIQFYEEKTGSKLLIPFTFH